MGQNEFAVALRLVAVVQSGLSITSTHVMRAPPQGLAVISPAAESGTKGAAQGSAMHGAVEQCNKVVKGIDLAALVATVKDGLQWPEGVREAYNLLWDAASGAADVVPAATCSKFLVQFKLNAEALREICN